jgi:hypothetical protein
MYTNKKKNTKLHNTYEFKKNIRYDRVIYLGAVYKVPTCKNLSGQ